MKIRTGKNVEQILQNASFENFLGKKITEVFKGEMNYFTHTKQLSRRMGKNMLYPDRKIILLCLYCELHQKYSRHAVFARQSIIFLVVFNRAFDLPSVHNMFKTERFSSC